jgi:hypothetical protein
MKASLVKQWQYGAFAQHQRQARWRNSGGVGWRAAARWRRHVIEASGGGGIIAAWRNGNQASATALHAAARNGMAAWHGGDKANETFSGVG